MFEEQHVRHVMSQSLPQAMQNEVAAILRLADKTRANGRRRRHASASATGKC
jgi:hypothetical protein